MNRLLVVSNDAGGAEILSAWVKCNQIDFDITYWLSGPAINIFKKKITDLNFYQNGLDGIRTFDRVITSTSWSTDLEKNVIKKAKQLKIPISTYLDHWTDFKNRFQLQNEMVLPDELWVGDVFAETLAKLTFPLNKVLLVPNLYIQDLVNQIKVIDKISTSDRGPNILYVTEPTSVVAVKKYGDKDYFGYTEFSALEEFLNYIDKQFLDYERIRIRPHPSEPSDKYLCFIQNKKFRIELSIDYSLIEDCAWADWVVGCQSMAMAIAVNAGKQVISCLPQGVESSLPYPEIKKIFQS